MKNPIVFLAFLLLVLGMPSQTLVAGNQDGTEPYLVKGQFELPLNTDEIREQWTVLGYRNCQNEGKDKGWTSKTSAQIAFIRWSVLASSAWTSFE